MKAIGVLTALAGLLMAANGFAQNEALTQAAALELQGRFAEASNVLSNALPQAGAQRKVVEFELDRLARSMVLGLLQCGFQKHLAQ